MPLSNDGISHILGWDNHSQPNNLTTSLQIHTTTTVLLPFFQDHPGEPVPEENFWTLWCKGRLTEVDTLTIRLGATPSRLTSWSGTQPDGQCVCLAVNLPLHFRFIHHLQLHLNEALKLNDTVTTRQLKAICNTISATNTIRYEYAGEPKSWPSASLIYRIEPHAEQ